ncbi:hypothetical protein KFK09_028192 [Dendrobium nobile]|uniref:F-box domain-containing protein n=1 Tax=Dendrobium nobile TaxID=94219 RepID=A0A8T3A6R7_DENNO|nr:hypothetical protein KFK09_028192 [Dendrobium nobile]
MRTRAQDQAAVVARVRERASGPAQERAARLVYMGIVWATGMEWERAAGQCPARSSGLPAMVERGGGDLLERLGPDLSAAVLRCLDDPTDLVRSASVSQSWHRFGLT